MSIIDLDGIHQQLLDINGDAHYFESEISIKLKPEDTSKKITCGVVSQDDLDNNTMNLEVVTTGNYYTNISNGGAKQKYQNYFLYINSSEPITGISVDINTNELQPPVDVESFEQLKSTKNNQTVFYVKMIMTLVVLIVGISLMMKFWKEK